MTHCIHAAGSGDDDVKGGTFKVDYSKPILPQGKPRVPSVLSTHLMTGHGSLQSSVCQLTHQRVVQLSLTMHSSKAGRSLRGVGAQAVRSAALSNV